jgi:hypothetical protein
MLWFYERDHVSLRLETRYDNDTAAYVGILHHPDGRQETQRFDNRDAFRAWLVSVEQHLEAERWTRDGPPDLLPDGWPDKTPQD